MYPRKNNNEIKAIPHNTVKGWCAKRTSDSKWLYKNSTTGDRGWYKEGSQPSGYSKYIYADKANISKSTSVDNDVVTFYAQWKKS